MIIVKKKAKIPHGGIQAFERARQHLKSIRAQAGNFKWESQAVDDFYEHWRANVIEPKDPIMAGFIRAKEDLVLKVATCVALSEYDTKLNRVHLSS